MDCFTAEEQTEVAGRQNIFVNLGGIVLSLLGGYLSAWNWRGTFLGFLLGVPILILAFRYLPKTTPVADQRRCTTDATHFRDRIPPLVPMVYIMMVMLFIVVYMTFSTNFSLLLTDRFGADTTAWFSGLGSGLFMFSGMCAGFLFSKLTKVFHNGILVLACLVLCAGFVVLSLANNLALVVVGIFLSGASFSLIIPQTVVIVSARVNQAQSLVASSLLMGVSPNIGGILSPLVFTKLSILMGHNDITFRFQFAAVAAVALILLYLWVLHWSKRREARAAASSAQS
jgi:MFS family permease